MYRASEILLDILEKNGFRNKSYQYIEDYGIKYKSVKCYDSSKQKKIFGLGHGRRRLIFDFDYISISVIEHGFYITDRLSVLDESKLRSMIAYFKCSRQKQQSIKKYCSNKIEMAGEIMFKRKEVRLWAGPFDSTFEKIYREVVL